MKILNISDELIQFSTYVDQIDLSFNQFLLLGSAPLLVHTGSSVIMQDLIEQIKLILKGREIEYLFISHFESDECGGIGLLLKNYPNLKILCSEVTSRELSGFGITNKTTVLKHGAVINSDSHQFEFIGYPSEVHLWDGLLLFERNSSTLFSSDLFLKFGKISEVVGTDNWSNLLSTITLEKVPSVSHLEKVKSDLQKLSVSIVAPGHGTCIKLLN